MLAGLEDGTRLQTAGSTGQIFLSGSPAPLRPLSALLALTHSVRI